MVDPKDSSRLLAEFFENFSDAFMVLDINFHIVQASEPEARYFAENFPGQKTCHETLKGEKSPCSYCPCMKTLADGNKHFRVYFNPKYRRWFRMTSFPIRDPKTGEIVRLVEYERDIDEQYRSEQALAITQRAVAHLSAPICYVTEAGIWRYMNAAAVRGFGYTAPEELIGGDASAQFCDQFAGGWQEFWRRLTANKTLLINREITRRDGTGFFADVFCDLVEIDAEKMMVACIRDLTDQAKRILAEQAAMAKSMFLAHMSHEIRTPLTGIIGFSDLLRGMALPPKAQRYVELLRTSGEHLLSLINDILDFSKIEADKLELENIAFDLSLLVDSAIELLAIKASSKGVTLRRDFKTAIPAWVGGDQTRLLQILVNLLNNALKFTERGGVTLSVEALTSPADWEKTRRAPLKFVIADTGVGIPSERLAQLFQSFSQVDASTARKYGGTGLGLAISKRLVNLMGGEIGVESQVNIGSTFWFTLPLALAEPAAESRTGDDGNRQRQPIAEAVGKILIAEDNEINQIIIGEILTQAGFTYALAANGEQAVAAFQTGEYALILMDCQMPDIDGFEATKLIRRLETAKSKLNAPPVPIIALTAAATAEDKQKCLAAGMNAYLSKPINPEQLIQVMSAQLAVANSAVK